MFNFEKISEILESSGICKNLTASGKLNPISNIYIDSRMAVNTENSLFIALVGNNFNGNDFVLDLYRKGVANFIVTEERIEFLSLLDVNIIYSEDALCALQELALYKKKESKSEIVGITGSNGKTVVKEWLFHMFSNDINVYRSPRSYNSQIGVPLSLLGIRTDTELAFIEAGISKYGEMQRLERIISPQIGIFTHLGDAHSENFKNLSEKLIEKIKLFDDCKVVICKNGKISSFLRSKLKKDTLLFTWKEGSEIDETRNELFSGEIPRKYVVVPDVIFSNKVLNPNKTTFKVDFKGKSSILTIPFGDVASYENAMTVISFMLYKGYKLEKIRERLLTLQPIAMRMEIKNGVNDCVLINDYYNSDFESFRLALNTLNTQDKSKNKVLILSDFIDNDINKDFLYKEIGVLMTKANISKFIGIGEDIVKYKQYFNIDKSKYYEDTNSFLRQENRDNYKNEIILIKGARKFKFEFIGEMLQKQSHRTVLEVDFNVMTDNLNYFRSKIPDKTRLAVMVKACSYGSGSVDVALFLQNRGVDYLMVAFADEGVELRAAGVNLPIAVMNPEIFPFDNIIEFNLEPEIYSFEVLKKFDKELEHHGVEDYPIHIKFNTGMNRSGFNEDELDSLLDYFKKNCHLKIRSVFSHLAASDEKTQDDFTKMQIEKFIRMSDKLQKAFNYKIIRHILNSAGIERFPQYAFEMVRLGIGLHGISFDGANLSPVSSLKTYISQIRNVSMENTVGYGRKGLLARDSKIGVIPIGYADGLNRHLSCGVGSVFVNGSEVPIVGNICMDVCMIDLTDIDAEIGDKVEIFGKNIKVSDISDKLGTIPYEVLTSVSSRVKRIYFKE